MRESEKISTKIPAQVAASLDARGWWRVLSGSLGASASATLAGVAANVLILRLLPPDDAGSYALLITLLYTAGTLAPLGQGTYLARFYHRVGATGRDWRADLGGVAALSLLVLLVSTPVLATVYALSAKESACLCIGAFLFATLSCAGSLLAEQRRYTLSNLLVRLPNAMLLLPAAAICLLPAPHRLPLVLAGLIAFLTLGLAVAFAALRRQMPTGTLRTSWRQRMGGLVFLASALGLLLPERGLIALAGVHLSPVEIAALVALGSFLRVFDLVGDAGGRVAAREMARGDRPGRRWLLLPLPVALGLAVAAWLALPSMVHLLFRGRYDAVIPLIPWLAAAAALRLAEVVPRTYLVFAGSERALHRSTTAHFLVALAGIALAMGWIAREGLPAVAYAALLIAAARLAVSYAFVPSVSR